MNTAFEWEVFVVLSHYAKGGLDHNCWGVEGWLRQPFTLLYNT